MKWTLVPLIIYSTCYSAFFFIEKFYIHAIISIVILILMIWFYCYFNTEHIFDLYSLHEHSKEYEHVNEKISEVNILKWIQTYRHPLIVKNDEGYVKTITARNLTEL
jgi:hypothetical protein